jgi:hypothetical protein
MQCEDVGGIEKILLREPAHPGRVGGSLGQQSAIPYRGEEQPGEANSRKFTPREECC